MKKALTITPLPHVITFDCYGTLIDWETGIHKILACILQEKGGSVTVAEFHRRGRHENRVD